MNPTHYIGLRQLLGSDVPSFAATPPPRCQTLVIPPTQQDSSREDVCGRDVAECSSRCEYLQTTWNSLLLFCVYGFSL